MKYDPETGLPELPEGYFWRFEDGWEYGRRMIRTRVMYYNKRGRAKMRWQRFYVIEWPVVDKRHIKAAAESLYEYYEDLIERKFVTDYQKVMEKQLFGDYPPRRIEED